MSRNEYAEYEDKDFMHEAAPKQYPKGTTEYLTKDYGDKSAPINSGSDLRSDNKASKKV